MSGSQQDVVIDAPNADADIVVRAKAMGHVDKEHFKGDPKDWIDAKEFVRRGDESIPILKSRLSKAEGSLARLQKDHGDLIKDSKQFKEMAYKQAETEWKGKVDGLKAELVAAREAGNHAEAVEIEEELATTRADKPAKPAATVVDAPPTEADPKLTAWFDENPWYKDNPKLRARANAMGVAFGEQGLTGIPLLDAVKEELQGLFPDEFGGEPRSIGSGRRRGSGANGAGPANRNTKSYDNLPDDAQKACDRLVKKGTCTQAEYLANYQWDTP